MDSERILIAHKDPLARGYLRLLAKRELPRADLAEAATFDALLTRLREDDSITLAVLDLDLPGMSRDVGLRHLTQHHAGTKIAVLFGRLSGEKLQELTSSGVAAVAPKQASEALLGDMFRLVLNTVPTASPARTRPDAHEAEPAYRWMVRNGLTERQREVMRLVSLGFSNRTIGRMLGIAEGTVKAHVNASFKVLGVHNRVSAVVTLRPLLEVSEEPLH